MSERRRFLWLSVLLLLVLVIASGVQARRIETRLLTRTQSALAAQGLAFYDIAVDGRDVVLNDDRSVAEEHRVAAIAAAVPGVRHVRTTSGSEPTGATDAAASGADRASARLQRRNGIVSITGRLSPHGAARLRSALAKLGDARLRDDLVVDPRLSDEEPSTDLATAFADIVGSIGDPGRITLLADRVVVTGVVATPEDATRIRAAGVAVPGVDWVFELFVAASDEGGSP